MILPEHCHFWLMDWQLTFSWDVIKVGVLEQKQFYIKGLGEIVMALQSSHHERELLVGSTLLRHTPCYTDFLKLMETILCRTSA